MTSSAVRKIQCRFINFLLLWPGFYHPKDLLPFLLRELRGDGADVHFLGRFGAFPSEMSFLAAVETSDLRLINIHGFSCSSVRNSCPSLSYGDVGGLSGRWRWWWSRGLVWRGRSWCMREEMRLSFQVYLVPSLFLKSSDEKDFVDVAFVGCR